MTLWSKIGGALKATLPFVPVIGGLKGKGHVYARGICPLCLREYAINSSSRLRSHLPLWSAIRQADDSGLSHDNQEPLPLRCDCGGRMVYDRDHGRVWSHCDTCTPTVRVQVN